MEQTVSNNTNDFKPTFDQPQPTQTGLHQYDSRKLVSDHASVIEVAESNEEDLSCLEKCQICSAEGCWGYLPCFGCKTMHYIYEFQRVIMFRFGKLHKEKSFDNDTGKETVIFGPGLVETLNGIDKMHLVDLREICIYLKPQTLTVTHNNNYIKVLIEGICFYEIFDPLKSVLQVENADAEGYIKQLSSDLLRDAIEKNTLSHLIRNKREIQLHIKNELIRSVERWGIRVIRVEIIKIIVQK